MAVQAQPVLQVTCREYLAWRFGVGVPYLGTLLDLARINAGHPLPKIPRSFVEASVRMVAERRRLRALALPLVARTLHAPLDRLPMAVRGGVVGRQQEDPQHVPAIQGDRSSPLGLAGPPVELNLGGVLPVQRSPVGGGGGASSQEQRGYE